LVKVLPKEDFIYFGDSKNAPYGAKSLEEVQKLTVENIDMLVEKEGVKAIVVACNTATSAAITLLREKYKNMPVIGIEPALKPAVLSTQNARVLVMATPMTIQEEKFHQLMEHYKKQSTIYPLSCPGLPELVEAGKLEGQEVQDTLKFLLEPYIGKIDAIVLGCTHYPFLKKEISSLAGEQVKLFDGSYGTAKEVKRRLIEYKLINAVQKQGYVSIQNSLENDIVAKLGETLFYQLDDKSKSM